MGASSAGASDGAYRAASSVGCASGASSAASAALPALGTFTAPVAAGFLGLPFSGLAFVALVPDTPLLSAALSGAAVGAFLPVGADADAGTFLPAAGAAADSTGFFPAAWFAGAAGFFAVAFAVAGAAFFAGLPAAPSAFAMTFFEATAGVFPLAGTAAGFLPFAVALSADTAGSDSLAASLSATSAFMQCVTVIAQLSTREYYNGFMPQGYYSRGACRRTCGSASVEIAAAGCSSASGAASVLVAPVSNTELPSPSAAPLVPSLHSCHLS